MAAVPLTGIDDFDVGNFVEVNFAQGPASPLAPPLRAIILANKTTAGSGTANTTIYGPDTQVPVATEADVIAVAGQGSPAHRMWKRFRRVNKSTLLYFVFVAESAGVAATGTIAVATNATGPATHRTFIGDEYVDATINTSDTPTVIGAAIQAAINANADLPVTALNAAGTVTLTAKVKGPRGNDIKIGSVILTPGSVSIGTTTTPIAMTALTGGTTADINTTALATILGRKFYYVISEAWDATQFGAVCTQATSESRPGSNNPQRPFAGDNGATPSTSATTTAVGINNALATLVWMLSSEVVPGELAAHMAAVVAYKELNFTSASLNLNGYGSDPATESWALKPLRSGAGPTTAQLKAAIQNGVTPIATSGTATYIHKWVTTRSLTAVSGTADYRAWAGHIPSVCHQLQFALQQAAGQKLKGKVIGDEPAPGEKFTADVVTPRRYFDTIVRPVLEDFGGRSLLERVDLIKLNTQCVREASPRTRISCRIPTTVRDILDSTATAIDQQPSFS